MTDKAILLSGLIILTFLPSVIGQISSRHQEDGSVSDSVDINHEPASSGIRLKRLEGAVEVRCGEQLFTRFDYSRFGKPILYPVLGPDQIPMTRGWPMEDKPGEAHDHPHHKSIWIGHMLQSGVDFWAEKSGTIVPRDCQVVEGHRIRTVNEWVAKSEKKVLLKETTEYSFGASETERWIDAQIAFAAPNQDVVFDDTKEGMFAVRTHPSLRLRPDEKRGVMTVTGKALNSQGTVGTRIWGQNAKWVYYYGKVNDREVGIAMFDHPNNLRHPTTWHAREYGLVAANPFGLHYFKKQPKGAGTYELKQGESLTFKYRVLFQLGHSKAKQLNQYFEKFAGQ